MRRLLGVVLVLSSILGVRFGEAQNRPVVAPRGSSLTAAPQSNLTFGEVFPGIRSTVSNRDNKRAGRFQIRGPKNTSVRIDMILPQAMTSTGGNEMPLEFGPSDGLAASNPGRQSGMAFNPWEPLVTVLGNNGRLYIRLGGSALPAIAQAPGTYSATIFLTVYSLGT